MAEDKKGFILYADQKAIFDQLTNEKAGELIKFIFAYVNDEDPKTEDLLLNLAFTPIKQQLKRDLVKFLKIKEKRSESGKAGAEKRWQKIANDSKRIKDIAKDSNAKNEMAKIAVTVNDNVNDNDNVINNKKDSERIFLEWFNSMALKHKGKEGRFKSLTQTDINNLKRLKESGYTLNDFENAYIAMINAKWVIENNMSTPAHFLRNDVFVRYLNTDKPKQQKSLDDKLYENVMKQINNK